MMERDKRKLGHEMKRILEKTMEKNRKANKQTTLPAIPIFVGWAVGFSRGHIITMVILPIHALPRIPILPCLPPIILVARFLLL
jgi:hypothetical protein